jgi:hypothetical protein
MVEVSRAVRLPGVWLSLGVLVTGWLVGCGGTSDAPAHGALTDGGATSPSDASPAPGVDSGSTTSSDDAGGAPDAPAEAQSPPSRNSTCTPTSEQTGTLVNTTHGRLDGTLVYILPVGGSSKCNGDDSHVHLQIEVSGLVYDVAVDIGSTGDDVGMYQETLAVPGGAWAEGWHGTDSLAYPTLGLTTAEFPTQAPTPIADAVVAALANTSKISIICTGYSQGDGCHDVHYEDGTGNDGAIVLDPTAATSPVLFFRFEGQSW